MNVKTYLIGQIGMNQIKMGKEPSDPVKLRRLTISNLKKILRRFK